MAKLFQDEGYVQYGNDSDFCLLCAMEDSRLHPGKNYYDTKQELTGQLLNKKVVKFRIMGTPRCICMDCIKKIYDKHIAPELSAEALDLKAQEEALLRNKNSENSDNK